MPKLVNFQFTKKYPILDERLLDFCLKLHSQHFQTLSHRLFVPELGVYLCGSK